MNEQFGFELVFSLAIQGLLFCILCWHDVGGDRNILGRQMTEQLAKGRGIYRRDAGVRQERVAVRANVPRCISNTKNHNFGASIMFPSGTVITVIIRNFCIGRPRNNNEKCISNTVATDL